MMESFSFSFFRSTGFQAVLNAEALCRFYTVECSYIDRNLTAAAGGGGWMMASEITKKNRNEMKYKKTACTCFLNDA